MSRLFDSLAPREPESFLTHPVSRARLAAEMLWWGWVMVGMAFLMCGLMIWHRWPRRPRSAPELPRDGSGKLIPPWRWEKEATRSRTAGREHA